MKKTYKSKEFCFWPTEIFVIKMWWLENILDQVAKEPHRRKI